jgi:CBS domain-containing membrane protein
MTKLRLHHWLRGFGPAVGGSSPTEAVRAGIGAAVGLGVSALFLLSPSVNLQTGLYLIAPFGATSVLIFAVPNSPLAQPWSAIMGNTVAAIVGVAVCMMIDDPAWRVALAIGISIAAMMAIRAVHPPAGAVALTAVLSPDAIEHLGFRFALTPVAVGTTILVVLAMIYARSTGRHYPFRQFDDDTATRTQDPAPIERIGLSEAELTELLQRYRQTLNLGVEDLARLIGAAEVQAASHRTGPLSAGDVMSKDLVTVGPDTPLSEVAELFRRHGFTALPVVEGGGKYLGIVFQIHLIRRAREDAERLERGFGAAMSRLLERRRVQPVRAADVMAVASARATPRAPMGALLPMLAEGHCDAVPILERGRIVGIVTRADLVAVLARQALRAG